MSAGSLIRKVPLLLKNTKVLSLLIALAALVLSQLPPIASWRRHIEVRVTNAEKMMLHSTIGLLGYELFLDFDNTGNRDVTITSIRASITSPGNNVVSLPSASYYEHIQGSMQPISYPLKTITLPAGETWSRYILFTMKLEPTEQQGLNEIRLQIIEDIDSEYQRLHNSLQRPPYRVPAKPETMQRTRDFFENVFSLKKGEHTLTISVQTNVRPEPFVYTSAFTVYESDINMLEAQFEDIKFGWGIAFPVSPGKVVSVDLSPLAG